MDVNIAVSRNDPGATWRLPRPARNAALIDDLVLDGTEKGIPGHVALRLADIGAQGWNLLKGDLPLPAALIRRDRLVANAAWMREFTRANGLEIAPHGKTTMAPQLFALQFSAGAWAITVATSQQMLVAARFGAPRIVMANQPTGRANIDACFSVLAEPDGPALHVLADSLDGVAALAAGARRQPKARPLGVLVEMGVAGGRTGARSRETALAVARAVAAAPGLVLAGIECFEGILPDVPAVDRLLDDVVAIAEVAAREGLFAGGGSIVLSAGGSSFYDRVGERFSAIDLGGRPLIRLIRSGCYLTHDDLGYEAAYRRILAETRLRLPPGRLEPALEIWAAVQSRPEPGKTILTMGKRDVSHDAGMPVPLKWFRPGAMARPEPMPRGHAVTGLNDQHCHMGTPGESPLAAGDLVGFGIGHPCTCFDKWRVMLVVDEDYRVLDALRTYF